MLNHWSFWLQSPDFSQCGGCLHNSATSLFLMVVNLLSVKIYSGTTLNHKAEMLFSLLLGDGHSWNLDCGVCSCCYCKLIWWNVPNGSVCVETDKTVWERSEQNAVIVVWLLSAQWSVCGARHAALVWQPGELCVPRALWARHWTTGLRSSTAQCSWMALGLTDSHSVWLCTAAFLDFTNWSCSLLQGQGRFGFWRHSGSEEQHPVSELWTSPQPPRITTDFLCFPLPVELWASVRDSEIHLTLLLNVTEALNNQ